MEANGENGAAIVDRFGQDPTGCGSESEDLNEVFNVQHLPLIEQ
jgi:hypothetical protein